MTAPKSIGSPPGGVGSGASVLARPGYPGRSVGWFVAARRGSGGRLASEVRAGVGRRRPLVRFGQQGLDPLERLGAGVEDADPVHVAVDRVGHNPIEGSEVVRFARGGTGEVVGVALTGR